MMTIIFNAFLIAKLICLIIGIKLSHSQNIFSYVVKQQFFAERLKRNRLLTKGNPTYQTIANIRLYFKLSKKLTNGIRFSSSLTSNKKQPLHQYVVTNNQMHQRIK